MSARHLNLRGLRALLWAGPTDGSSKDVGAYSRRQMFGLAGGAAASVGVWSMAPAPRGDTSGPFTLWSQRDRVEFRLGDTARWVIDTSWFVGTPRLDVAEGPHRTRIRLSGARYPGTDISADLVAEVRRTRLGRRLTLDLAFGNFAGEVPLEAWLRGDATLTRRLELSMPLIAGGPGPRVEAAGQGTLQFSPNWDLDLRGAHRPLARPRGAHDGRGRSSFAAAAHRGRPAGDPSGQAESADHDGRRWWLAALGNAAPDGKCRRDLEPQPL